jgi:transposase, IS30 family
MATTAKKHAQLNAHERFTIELLLKNGKTQADIAKELHKSPSTISREISRNKTEHGYCSERAQHMYLLRREYPAQDRKFNKLSNAAIACIVEHLHKRSSP